MSILKKLEKLYPHCCENCEYFAPYGVMHHGEVDCDLDDGRTLDKEYFYEYFKKNDCKFFKYRVKS